MRLPVGAPRRVPLRYPPFNSDEHCLVDKSGLRTHRVNEHLAACEQQSTNPSI